MPDFITIPLGCLTEGSGHRVKVAASINEIAQHQGMQKTAISLPQLIRDTNAFSLKNVPGCVPTLTGSDPQQLFLRYNVKCKESYSDPLGHDVQVKFDVTKVEQTQKAADLDVKLRCGCPAFVWWSAEYNLSRRDGLLGEPRGELVAPKKDLDLRTNFVLCIAPGTHVLMADGTEKLIEDVQVGDYVITHKGRARKVTHIASRPSVEGELAREIKVEGRKDPLVLSEDHPIASVRGNEECGCGCGTPLKQVYVSNTPSKRSRKPWSHCFNPGHGRRERVINHSMGRMLWKNPTELIAQELLYYPKILWAGTKEVNSDLASLLGYYLAEGSITTHTSKNPSNCAAEKVSIKGISNCVYATHFTLHSNERFTLAADIEMKARRLLGEETKIVIRDSKSSNSCRVEITNSKFAAEMFKLGGNDSLTKRLSAEVLSWCPNAMMEVAASYALGDGGLTKRGHKLASSSRDLITQISMFLYSMGIWHGLTYEDRPEGVRGYRLHWDYRKSPQLLNLMKNRLRPQDLQKTSNMQLTRKSDTRYWQDGFLRVLQSVTSIPAPRLFHDLTIEEDESFIANGVVVHNCKHAYIVFTRILPSVQHNIVKILRERTILKNKEKNQKVPDKLQKKLDEMKERQQKNKGKGTQKKLLDAIRQREDEKLKEEKALEDTSVVERSDSPAVPVIDTPKLEELPENIPVMPGDMKSEQGDTEDLLAEEENRLHKEQEKEHEKIKNKPHLHEGLPYETEIEKEEHHHKIPTDRDLMKILDQKKKQPNDMKQFTDNKYKRRRSSLEDTLLASLAEEEEDVSTD